MTDDGFDAPDRFSRRTALGAAAALGAAGMLQWTPAFQVPAGAASVVPPGFPASIPLYQQAYRNWAGDIAVDALWTCAPRTPAEVVTIANWARSASYRIRPRGKMHNWSPLVVTAGSTDANQVLLDTTQHLTAISVASGSPATVTAQTGITMEALLTRLEQSGYGLTATPAPGELTLGGVLAIDGHGTAVPANGETRVPGTTYGSISNLVTSLTAVVWNASTSQYALRTFSRNDPAIRPLLTHVGRSFVTEVTLQVGANQRLRCQSWFDINWNTMFAPTAVSRSFSSYMTSAGRVEAIWFPFTDNPWLKVWSRKPSKPLLSRQVNSPYNYPFSDTLSADATSLVAQIIAGNGSLTPTFGTTQIAVVGSGLITTGTWDIWGWSKNTLLYVRPTTLKVTANGYAIHTTRANVQRVVNEFATFYRSRMDAYRALGRYPMNGPVEIRVTGIDSQADLGVPTAGPPSLSALRPRPDRPAWDTAVWLDILTIPGTPYANEFYREVEQWVYTNYSGSYAAVRPEWSKGWGYTNSAAWADATQIATTVPNTYRTGQPAGDNWDTARAALNSYDPHRVFSNAFIDQLLP